MELNLKNRTALITGSSYGIGKTIAKHLHAEGCHVALNARGEASLEETSAKLNGSISIVGDVTKQEEAHRIVNETINAFGKLDILVCNVGSGRSIPPGEESADEWNRVFALNLWSTTNMVQAASKFMKISKGSIICISSICGLEVIPEAPLTYSAAKAALNSYVRGIARPLGKEGIRINAIAPGNILFENSVWDRKLLTEPEFVKRLLKENVSLNTLGSAEDVAQLVCYLASSSSKFATGSIFTLDGGQVHS